MKDDANQILESLKAGGEAAMRLRSWKYVALSQTEEMKSEVDYEVAVCTSKVEVGWVGGREGMREEIWWAMAERLRGEPTFICQRALDIFAR